MKKRGLAAALAMLTMATTGTAFAAPSFWQPVYYTNVGYNASTVKKVANSDHAYIGVTGSNHNELSTNYLEIWRGNPRPFNDRDESAACFIIL